MEISEHSCFFSTIKKLKAMSTAMGRGRYQTPSSNYPFLEKLHAAGCIPEIHVVCRDAASITVATHINRRGGNLDNEILEFFI